MKIFSFLSLLFFTHVAFAQTKISIALNWKAEPQFGGFYQALVDGEFKKHHLDVTLLEGGSGAPTIQMLANKKIDLAVVGGEELLISRDRNGSAKAVALFASYQSYPAVIMTHAEKNYKDLQAVFRDSKTIALQAGLPYFQYLIKKYGQPKGQVVPYVGGIGAFSADTNLAQQGFVNSEPLLAEKKGLQVKNFLIAKEGFNPYTTVLAANAEWIQAHPQEAKDLVQALRAGWESYLKSPEKANVYMATLNPAMDLKTFAESAKAQKNLIRTGHQKLGQMTEARWKELIDQLVELKLVQKTFAPGEIYKIID